MLPKKTLTTLITICMMLLGTGMVAAQDQELAVQPLRIHTVLAETDEPFVDVCYDLEGFTTAPQCDTDGDGLITIENVPIGTYNLAQTADIGNLYPVGEPGVDLGSIAIRNEDNNNYRVKLIEAEATTDLGIITRDPETGDAIEGACYVLKDYSNVGCDDDGNGIITFEDIPWGRYTIQQTTTPEGHEPLGDYDITLTPNEESETGEVIIPLIQAETQGADTATNISVVVIDAESGDRVASKDTCVQFPGMTNVGCDDGIIDGQIDFLGIDPTSGQPTFEVTSLGCGYEQANTGESQLHRVGDFHSILVLTVNVIPADCVG